MEQTVKNKKLGYSDDRVIIRDFESIDFVKKERELEIVLIVKGIFNLLTFQTEEERDGVFEIFKNGS
jgi:hypothetical protein